MAHFVFYDLPPEAKEEIARLRWQMAGNRMLLACYRLEALLGKAGFKPDQARVPAGSPDGGQWTGGGDAGTAPASQHIGSGRAKLARVAASADPLKPRSGNNPAAQVSSLVNAIASGRVASVAATVGTGVQRADVRIRKLPGDQVSVDISTLAGSVRTTGMASSAPGKVTISDLNLTTPGMLNPLHIVSAPTEVTVLDLPDGRLALQVNRRLNISVLGRTVVDLPPEQTMIVPDR